MDGKRTKTISNEFIGFMWEFSKRDIPEYIVDECKLCLLDYIGCANLGQKLLCNENKKYVESFGSISGVSSVIGSSIKLNSYEAALLNGINAHYIELDDGHRYAMLHPGTPVISALLAVAQEMDLSASQFICGLVCGYEATVRLASAIQPEHKLKGYHATGTCGTVGAAIGLLAALEYPIEFWSTAVAVAATSASGLLQVMDDSSELKPFNAGKAAASAVTAVRFAVTGLSAPKDVLGGNRGFVTVLSGKCDEEALLGDADKYAIETIYRKPYASCRHTHAAIEAVLNIVKANAISYKDIKRIEIDTYGLAVKGHDHTDIQSVSSARMSMPYAVAVAAKNQKVNFQQYNTECLKDSDINKLMGIVNIREDPELSALVPAKRAAIVRVFTENMEYENRVDYPLGEPENPMDKKTLEDKYRSLMTAAEIEESIIEQLLADINDLENGFQDLLMII